MEEIVWYFLVVAGVFVCACSQLLLKSSAMIDHTSSIKTILNWRVIVAYCIVLISIPINITAMQHGVGLKNIPILESLGYIFVPALSFYYLRERINFRTLVSIVLIITGVVLFYL